MHYTQATDIHGMIIFKQPKITCECCSAAPIITLLLLPNMRFASGRVHLRTPPVGQGRAPVKIIDKSYKIMISAPFTPFTDFDSVSHIVLESLHLLFSQK